MATLLTLTTPPSGDNAYISAIAIEAVFPQFQWGPGVTALNVQLFGGASVLVETTQSNINSLQTTLATTTVQLTIPPSGGTVYVRITRIAALYPLAAGNLQLVLLGGGHIVIENTPANLLTLRNAIGAQ